MKALDRQIVISCEHGGREVPPDYAEWFAGQEELLDSHRGWDPGALELAREMAAQLKAPLFWSTTTRLLVDLNRSIGHRRLHSEITRDRSREERAALILQYYRPHRDAVEGHIAQRIAAGAPVLHIASHSFTPMFYGVERNADIGWLYDPRRAEERAFSDRWMQALHRHAPELRLRRNYPYRGGGDGLATLLRKRFEDASYLGIELEVSQRFALAGGEPWQRLRRVLVTSLMEAQALVSESSG